MTRLIPRQFATCLGSQQAQGSRLTTQVSSLGGQQQLKRQQLQQFQLLRQLQPLQLLQMIVGRLFQEFQAFERLVQSCRGPFSLKTGFVHDLTTLLGF